MHIIIGGMGFVGQHTARRFLDVGEEIIVTQYRTRRVPEFLEADLDKGMRVEVLDVTDSHQVFDLIKRTKPDGIVNLVNPRPGSLNWATEYKVNMDGLINVLEAARINEVRRVQIASSMTVYNGAPEGPFRESMPLPIESRNLTEAFKKAWEILALNYADSKGMDVVIGRVGGIYGPLYETMGHHISKMCYAAAHGEPADFSKSRMGEPFAEEARGYCYVKDTAQGVQLLQMTPKLNHRTYNISGGAGSCMTYGDIAKTVQRVVPGTEIPLPEGPGPNYKSNPYMDISRAREDLDFEPKYDLERGVEEYIGWLKGHIS